MPQSRAALVKPRPVPLPPEPLIVMLSGCRWSSCGGGQRPAQLARCFERMGYGVVYHNPMIAGCEQMGNIYTLDKPRFRRAINQLAECHDPRNLVINALPIELFHAHSVRLQAAGWRYVYDLIDDWPSFRARGDLNYYDEDDERAIMETADALTASAPSLLERFGEWAGREGTLVRNGGPAEPVARPWPMPPGWVTSRAGTVVYIGYLAGQWFDWPLFRRTTKALPDVVFHVIGDNSRVRGNQAENIIYHGEMPYAECIAAAAWADVGIVPFRHLDICRAVDPIKLYDHWAMGQPLAATSVMTELAGRPHCHIAPTGARDIAAQVEAALLDAPIQRAEVEQLCAANSWDVRAAEIIAAVEAQCADSNSDRGGSGGQYPCEATRGARVHGLHLRCGRRACREVGGAGAGDGDGEPAARG